MRNRARITWSVGLAGLALLPVWAAEISGPEGYFGAPMAGISESEALAFDRGFQIFARAWPSEREQRNAESCVTCHSLPMPGGSGASQETLVLVDAQTGIPHHVGDGRSISIQGALRRPPPLFGLGLLEFSDGLENAARFGSRGQTASLHDFVFAAFAFELGVSTSKHCVTASPCRPGISDAQVNDVVTFLRFLSPPPARSAGKGAEHFRNLNCDNCHTPISRTDFDAPLSLAGMTFAAYTDQKFHSLGPSPKIVTPPLWGLSSVGPPYWHDGSVGSIEETILAHGGEAAEARAGFLRMTQAEQEALLAFLRSL